jgi:hypothetical protein
LGALARTVRNLGSLFFQGKKARLSLSLGPGFLTEEQKNVLNAALGGKNIFFTGL